MAREVYCNARVIVTCGVCELEFEVDSGSLDSGLGYTAYSFDEAPHAEVYTRCERKTCRALNFIIGAPNPNAK